MKTDMYRTDSHCHLWSLERGDYGWLESSDPELAPIGGIVGWVGLADFHAEARLGELAAMSEVKGIRPMVQDIELLSSSEKQAFIRGNATRFYNLGGSQV
jgi:predicted TIM-barrel fold metal-dependent hydrolase